jgi:ABC-2 type transport system ATP-binding protein
VEISFDKNITTKSLSEISHITEVRKEGDKFIITSDDINGFINSLTDFVISKNLKITSLNTMEPSLEDVFLQLTDEV